MILALGGTDTQVNGTEESSRMNPYTYGQLIFNELPWQSDGEGIIFPERMMRPLDTCPIKSYLTPYTKINLKWITDLNINAKPTKLLDKNLVESLCDLGVGKDFSGTMQKHSPWEKN